MDPLLKRLQEITGKQDLKSWYFDEVKDPHKIENLDYYIRKKTEDRVIINPKLIVGSYHNSYNGLTWLQMLGYLHHNKSVTKEKALSTIDDYEINGKKHVAKINGQFYICDGNHRLCFAKFLNFTKITVDVTEYVFDAVRYELECNFKKRNIQFFKEDELDLWRIYLDKNPIRIKEEFLADFFKYIDNYQVSNKELFLFAYNEVMKFGNSPGINRILINSLDEFHLAKQEIRQYYFKKANIIK